MEEAGEEAEAEDGADDDLKTRTPHNDVGKKRTEVVESLKGECGLEFFPSLYTS